MSDVIRRRRDPMPAEFEELAHYNGRAFDGVVFPPEYVAEMAALQEQFDAWNEWQLRREGFRPLAGNPGLWVLDPAEPAVRRGGGRRPDPT